MLAFELAGISVSGAPGVVAASKQLNGIGPVAVFVKNTGSQALTAARIKLGPDATALVTVDTSLATLAAGAAGRVVLAAPVDFFQVELESSGGTTVRCAVETAVGN